MRNVGGEEDEQRHLGQITRVGCDCFRVTDHSGTIELSQLEAK
jgi:hypothetical protein